MKINHLITFFLIAAATAFGCLFEKPEDNKPMEITFSAAVILQNPEGRRAQFQNN